MFFVGFLFVYSDIVELEPIVEFVTTLYRTGSKAWWVLCLSFPQNYSPGTEIKNNSAEGWHESEEIDSIAISFCRHCSASPSPRHSVQWCFLSQGQRRSAPSTRGSRQLPQPATLGADTKGIASAFPYFLFPYSFFSDFLWLIWNCGQSLLPCLRLALTSCGVTSLARLLPWPKFRRKLFLFLRNWTQMGSGRCKGRVVGDNNEDMGSKSRK